MYHRATKTLAGLLYILKIHLCVYTFVHIYITHRVELAYNVMKVTENFV